MIHKAGPVKLTDKNRELSYNIYLSYKKFDPKTTYQDFLIWNALENATRLKEDQMKVHKEIFK